MPFFVSRISLVRGGFFAVLIAVATPGAEAWQTVVKPEFVPNGTLVILGDGVSRQSTVTVSCIVDRPSGDIRKLFVDVTAPPLPPEAMPERPVTLSLREAD